MDQVSGVTNINSNTTQPTINNPVISSFNQPVQQSLIEPGFMDEVETNMAIPDFVVPQTNQVIRNVKSNKKPIIITLVIFIFITVILIIVVTILSIKIKKSKSDGETYRQPRQSAVGQRQFYHECVKPTITQPVEQPIVSQPTEPEITEEAKPSADTIQKYIDQSSLEEINKNIEEGVNIEESQERKESSIYKFPKQSKIVVAPNVNRPIAEEPPNEAVKKFDTNVDTQEVLAI